MTINYPITTINTKPIPPIFISIPQEEREKTALEKGVGIWEVPWTKGEVEFVETRIDWVSHGNYAIMQPKRNKEDIVISPWIYMSMEFDYFDQIIEAFESTEKPKPSGTDYNHLFEPFWKADVPMRGMLPWPERLQTFFYREKEGLILQKQTHSEYGNLVKYLGFTIEDFKKVRDAVHSNTNEKPIHYVRLG